MKSQKKIKLIAFDVDGTLTNGEIALGPDGEIFKTFYAQDGLAIAAAHRLGYRLGIITGRNSSIVMNRAKELSMDFALMKVSHKVEALGSVLEKFHLSWDEAAYMGDDLNDLPLFSRVGWAGCPANACAECKEQSDFISSFIGGRGAARSFIENILKSQNRWNDIVHSFAGNPR